MGLTKHRARGQRAVLEGWTAEGRASCPINPSGGLKAKGHPIGATGVSMHAITAMQFDRPGTRRHAVAEGRPRRGMFNMGGAAVANYVSASWSRLR